MRTPGAVATTLALLALAACSDSSGFPAGTPPGGGGHPGGMNGGDGGPGSGPDASVPAIVGSVCEVADVRMPDACAAVKRADLTITVLRTDGVTMLTTTRTDAQGRFAAAAQPSVGQVIVLVDDPTLQLHRGALAVQLDTRGAANLQLSVLSQNNFDTMVNASVVQPLTPGNGVVAVHVIHDEASVADAVVGQLSGHEAFYDANNDPFIFQPGGKTSALGFAIWFDVAPALSSPYNVKVGLATIDHSTLVAADALVFTTANQ